MIISISISHHKKKYNVIIIITLSQIFYNILYQRFFFFNLLQISNMRIISIHLYIFISQLL